MHRQNPVRGARPRLDEFRTSSFRTTATRPRRTVFGLNPGVSGVSWGVFEIPAGATATSVSVPIGTSLQQVEGVDQVLVELTR